MAESLGTSQVKGKRSTTTVLTPELLLEIFQEGIVRLQKAGIDIRVAPMFGDGDHWIDVELHGVEIVDHHLVLTRAEVVNTGNL